MERRRLPFSTILFLLIMFFMFFAPFFGDYSSILLIVFIIVIAVLMIINARRRKIFPEGAGPRRAPDYYRPPSRAPIPTEWPRIGKWILIPITIVGVIAFILFQNWSLNISILRSMYSLKAGLDWWRIHFLNDHYFYACMAIGLLIALSDPRISIIKDASGKRRVYLYSKFWGVVKVIRGLISQYTVDGVFPTRVSGLIYDDKVSLKLGLAWKVLEFLVGTFIIGPSVAQSLALQYLMISKWLATQNTSWVVLLQRTASVLWTRLFTSDLPTGSWLIENSPILEFLTFIRTPINMVCTLWGIRQGVSLIFNVLRGNIPKAFKSGVLIALAVLTPLLLVIPTQVFDITTPFFVRSMVIGELTLIVLSLFFSLRESWVQRSISFIYRRRIVLIAIVALVSISILYGPVVIAAQYAPAMEGNWKNWVWTPKIQPMGEYTRWATGLDDIAKDDLVIATNTGENLEILSDIRVFNDAASKLRLKPSIGVNWMDIQNIDIILLNGREYWVSALTIVQSPTGEDQWRSQRLIITHSERILAIDASTGEIVTGQDVFNYTETSSIYYGEDGLFKSSDIVYIDIPGFQENHLPDYTGSPTYDGTPDYVLTGFERLWFFSGIYGQERLQLDFARGDYGEIKMLYLRDVRERLSHILLPGMTVDNDPLLVSDGQNLYYALYVYVDRPMPTGYLDSGNNFWRIFSVVLINAYDGKIEGYLMNQNEENYVVNFYQSMYPQWDQPIPAWLIPQLRYPEFLFERQIDSYNIYHVTDPDIWQGNTDFFALTTNINGIPIEDVRFVSFSLNQQTYWAAIRLVEKDQAPGKNLAAMYVALNGEDLGSNHLLRTGDVAVIGPQTVVDTVSNYSPTKSLLSLHPNWKSGNILMYVVNGTLYYFVPYYAETETTLSPAMLACIDAFSQKVGYYVINDPQNPVEVGGGAEKAYLDLVGLQIELTAAARRNNTLNMFNELNYSIHALQIPPEANVKTFSSVNYLTDDAWSQTQVAITSFLDTQVKPLNQSTIFMWETVEAEKRILNFGVLVDKGWIELHYLKIAYASG